MKIRYRLLASALAVVLLTNVLAGTASASQTTARPIKAPPAVQVKPDGTVVFTAVKRGATSITPNAIIVCSVYPQVPRVASPEVVATAFTSCNHGVALIAMTITLIHVNNWWVTKVFESDPGADSLFAVAGKICLPDVYRTKVFTQVYFPIDYIPPSASRTDYSEYVRITQC
jgi:hypothetical protein